jgi:hypothetical protein
VRAHRHTLDAYRNSLCHTQNHTYTQIYTNTQAHMRTSTDAPTTELPRIIYIESHVQKIIKKNVYAYTQTHTNALDKAYDSDCDHAAHGDEEQQEAYDVRAAPIRIRNHGKLALKSVSIISAHFDTRPPRALSASSQYC